MKSKFQKAVERLAADAAEQERYLIELGTTPSVDELALEFSDALTAERVALDPPVLNAADRLDDFLAEISGEENAHLWTVSALGVAPEWERVRNLARELLGVSRE